MTLALDRPIDQTTDTNFLRLAALTLLAEADGTTAQQANSKYQLIPQKTEDFYLWHIQGEDSLSKILDAVSHLFEYFDKADLDKIDAALVLERFHEFSAQACLQYRHALEPEYLD